jgi:crossover junction endodeoxyribonuclease RuvC
MTPEPTVFVGVDPGCPLTIAVLGEGYVEFHEEDEVATRSRKGKGKTMLYDNNPILINGIVEGLVSRHDRILAVIEHVQPAPKQGISSTARFVGSMYLMQGILAAHRIPVTLIRPAKWKGLMGLGREKEQSRKMAIELCPFAADRLNLCKHHDRAEALLLAHMLEQRYRK